MGHAILERVRLFGTRSADYIRASGHNGCIATEVTLQATTEAEYMTAPERFADSQIPLAPRAPSIHLCHPTMDFAVMHNAAGALPYRVRPPSIILAMRPARFAIGGAAGSARGQRYLQESAARSIDRTITKTAWGEGPS
jgi:hypothetical protein